MLRRFSITPSAPQRSPLFRPLSRWFSSEASSDNKGDDNSSKADEGAAKALKQSKSLAPILPASKTRTMTATGGSSSAFPEAVEVIPLFRRPLVPGMFTSLSVVNPHMMTSLNKKNQVGLFFVKPDFRVKGPVSLTSAFQPPPDISSLDQIYQVGMLGSVIEVAGMRDGATNYTIEATQRIVITDHMKEKPRLTVRIRPYEDLPFDRNDPEIKAYTLEFIQMLKEFAKYNTYYAEQINFMLGHLDLTDPVELAEYAAALFHNETDLIQSSVVEERNVAERLRNIVVIMRKELDTIKLQAKIQKQLEEKISSQQRKYFLSEQLKQIKKELGLETDEKETLLAKFRERLEGKEVPAEAKRVIDEEMTKLGALEASSTEFNVTRNYLDWLTSLPWGTYSKESLDMNNAQVVMDEDHYGLKDVKERILEFIAVGTLKGSVQGKIMCLVGPPGVGKTSIGKSVARSLGRQFFRFSVGGMGDVAEIKGHRRTYVGAMPGKLLQCLKTVKTSNPVIMIDEIDKLGRGWTGDPSSALLEVLDPEQNNAFLDHYLDVPFDLSKVLFICTANVLDTIPKPLLDRMEVIRLSGYVTDEKVAITKRHLLPLALTESGLKQEQIKMKDGAIKELIKSYCRESGVRNLQKHIEKVYRKVAFNVARGLADTTTVTAANLQQFVGKPVYSSDRYYERTPIGVTMGLAWTSMGGATLYIETVSVNNPHLYAPQAASSSSASSSSSSMISALPAPPPSRGPESDEKEDKKEKRRSKKEEKEREDYLQQQMGRAGLKTTGQMGDVMKESTDIAYTYARAFLKEVDPKNTFFDRASIHMHIPEGATPKDGPSAGGTMVTSLLSLALNSPVRNNLAMTGELTLTGKILPIGGVKEKTIAARRSRVKHIILPEANRKDWDELDEFVRQGLTVHFVSQYSDIFKLAFRQAVQGRLAARKSDKSVVLSEDDFDAAPVDIPDAGEEALIGEGRSDPERPPERDA